MKILFINPSLRPEAKRRQLPVGLAYVLTAAKRAGYDFDLIDMDIDLLTMDELEQILIKKQYDVYAFGCIVTGFKHIKKIIEIVRRINPASLIIAGNSVATSIPEILLTHTPVDIVVLGEGDETIIDLLKIYEEKKDFSRVKGIAFKKDGKIIFTPKRTVIPCLDDVGFPEWTIFDLQKYAQYTTINVNTFSFQDALSFPLNSARGCPFQCTFCYHVFKGEKYRRYSAGAVVEEIKRLHKLYRCNFVSFWDELTFPNIKSVENMVNSFGKIDFQFGWEAPVRGDLFKKTHLSLIRDMKAVGCDSISFSLENADPAILNTMNKKMTVPQFIEQAKVLWDGGVIPLTSVVFGYPQETQETIKHTLEVCRECNIYPSVGFLLPLPGTPIYDWAKIHGYIRDEIEYLSRIDDRQDFHINLTAMSDEEFIDTVRTGLENLAEKLGLKLDSVFKTVTYQAPQNQNT